MKNKSKREIRNKEGERESEQRGLGRETNGGIRDKSERWEGSRKARWGKRRAGNLGVERIDGVF